MTPYDYIILALALCGIARVWWERYQDRLSDADERARRQYGRFSVKEM